MPDLDRDVAGIRCREVLAHLSDYLDGELDDDTRARIEEHLHGCDWCERFGGSFGEVVAALRRQMGAAPELDADVQARLRERLKDAV